MNGIKRKGQFAQDGSRKSAKSDDDTSSGKPKMSFAERMMAKMGHKKGEGLGKEGNKGIVEPVQVTLRAQKVGLGAVKEKSEQQKREERRRTEQRGEKWIDSDEEDREEQRRRRKAKVDSRSSTGTPKPKTKYQTAADVEEEGLHLPPVLKEVYNMTGKEPKLLTSTTGLMLGNHVRETTPSEQLAVRARRDVQAFADTFHNLSETEKTLLFQDSQLERELDLIDDQIREQSAFIAAISGLQELSTLEETLTSLEQLQSEWSQLDDSIAVAALRPYLQKALSEMDSLPEDSTQLPSQLLRVGRCLKIGDFGGAGQALEPLAGHSSRKKRETSVFESMLLQDFLPRARVLVSRWDATTEAMSMVSFYGSWAGVLPSFLKETLSHMIAQKLTLALQSWTPRSSKKKATPHAWLLPWLKVLTTRDRKEILGILKSKVSLLLSNCKIAEGPPALLSDVSDFLPIQQLLVRYVLPRLAAALRNEFILDPSDQEMDVWNAVSQWRSTFSAPVFGELVVKTLADKISEVLHMWLSSDEVSYDEVGQWVKWIRETFGEGLENEALVQNLWQKCFEAIHVALDQREQGKTELQLPGLEPDAYPTEDVRPTVKETNAAPEIGEATFKDIIESWAGEENLLLLPLREAHVTTGLPLFRITASATGKGGVLVYMKGDVLYAQNRKDRSSWDPIGLGEQLISMAEGK